MRMSVRVARGSPTHTPALTLAQSSATSARRFEDRQPALCEVSKRQTEQERARVWSPLDWAMKVLFKIALQTGAPS